MRKEKVSKALHIIVFSKDRAAQLDCLLRTIAKNLTSPLGHVYVLYRSSSDEFRSGYDRLRTRVSKQIRFVEEQNFRTDLFSILAGIEDESFLMFLVDDDIMLAPIDVTTLLTSFTKRHLFISLRCSRTYPGKLPFFFRTDPILEWRWDYQRKPVTWNYPFSVDGNMFASGHIKKLIKSIDFQGPNSLEGRLHRIRHHRWSIRFRPRALGPTSPVIVNNPMNSVQTEGSTWHQDISPEMLNREFLSGKIIDDQPFYSHVPSGTHEAISVRFVSG